MKLKPTAPPDASPRLFKPLAMKAALVLLSFSLCAVFAELGLRVFFHQTLFLGVDERSMLYRYDPVLGWFPMANDRARFRGSRTVTIVHNREGFRGPEHVNSDKPVIIFLGDSFTWGFDVEESERFTEKLQARHREWSVYNLGVSGYGTDQEYLLLQKHYDEYRPRVVFLMYCTETDDEDNASNVRYGGYYKPYCTVVGTRLELHGIPVPHCERAFLAQHDWLSRSFLVRLLVRGWFKCTSPPELRNPVPTGPIIRDLEKFVARKGGRLVVGLTKTNPNLEKFLAAFKIPYVALDTDLRYKEFGRHWTPAGHTFVCDKIEQFLEQGKFMEGPSKDGRP